MREWDMHDPGAAPVVEEHDRLAIGTEVTGEVVCHHHYGLGVRLDERDEYAHVDIISIGLPDRGGPADFPPIGSRVRGKVLGYAGDQLKLILRRE
jgi:hypothetical protein